jgi:ribosomal protein L37AE/L43A
MLLAMRDGKRNAEPEPRGRADCPLCKTAVIAKCGRIVIWHWAHETGSDCDPWAETPGPWHRGWQESVPAGQREVVIGEHRADIMTNGYVIELQHSPISPEEIQARERYYKQHTNGLIWIFNAEAAFTSNRLDLRPRPAPCPGCRRGGRLVDEEKGVWYCEKHEFEPYPRYTHYTSFGELQDPYRSLRWKHPRKSLAFCREPVYLDLGNGWLFKPSKIFWDKGAPYGGDGLRYRKQDMQQALQNGPHGGTS